MEESLLELAGGPRAFGIDFTAFLQPGLGETDPHAAKQAQGKRGLGLADPALIFSQGYVQRVMPTALRQE